MNVLWVLTCILILVLGHKTLKIRDQNNGKLQNIANFHGEDAERINTIQRLSRSMKDVLKLNILTCVFLFPLIVVSFVRLFLQPGSAPLWLLIIAALANLFYLISNPVIYLCCFTKIREYLYWAICIGSAIAAADGGEGGNARQADAEDLSAG